MIRQLIVIFAIVSGLSAVEFKFGDKLEFKINLGKGYKFGNTLQGITYNDKEWIVMQTDHNKAVIFNFLNKNGTLIRKHRISYPSHGQDLSLFKKRDKIFLVTTGRHNHGIAIFSVQKNLIQLYKEVFINLSFNTPTVSKDGLYIAVKSYGFIQIYRVSDILKLDNPIPIFSFSLIKEQQKKSNYFQGIEFKDGLIYTLSGNKTLDSKKYLVIYDSYGQVVKKKELKTGRELAIEEGIKWELEGLSFKGDSLYTTVMSGRDGKNIKRMYKILEIK